MTQPAVLVTSAGGVTRLTLARPDKLNPMSRAFYDDMMAALDGIEKDESCRVVVLTGSGRGFCSGQELGPEVYVPGGPQPDLGAVVARYNGLMLRLYNLQKPMIGAVNGIAAGAGTSLAWVCDIVIAKKSARFVQAFARIGLIPDCGATYFLPRLVGEVRARALAMLAEPVTAEQAEAWGMIWKAVPDDMFDAEVDALAARLASAPTYSLALQKQAFHASLGNGYAAQLKLEHDLQRLAGAAPDFVEGVDAFLAKRPARFTGRS